MRVFWIFSLIAVVLACQAHAEEVTLVLSGHVAAVDDIDGHLETLNLQGQAVQMTIRYESSANNTSEIPRVGIYCDPATILDVQCGSLTLSSRRDTPSTAIDVLNDFVTVLGEGIDSFCVRSLSNACSEETFSIEDVNFAVEDLTGATLSTAQLPGSLASFTEWLKTGDLTVVGHRNGKGGTPFVVKIVFAAKSAE